MNWDEITSREIADQAPAVKAGSDYAIGFEMGAEWQRNQLRTDEAVERVAEGIHDIDCVCGNLRNPEYEGTEGSEYYRRFARAAIAALIGEA